MRFLLYWLILNLTGFTLGSLHGATDHGFIPSVIPGYVGLIIGDLVFGGMVGFVQYYAFTLTKIISTPNWWILATSIGFTLGARIGSLLTFRVVDNWILAGVVFGIFMGISIGCTTGLVLQNLFSPRQILAWILLSIIAWAVGESIAFSTHFKLSTVPLVALAISSITGLGILKLSSRNSST